jgi:hypothetical protein
MPQLSIAPFLQVTHCSGASCGWMTRGAFLGPRRTGPAKILAIA